MTSSTSIAVLGLLVAATTFGADVARKKHVVFVTGGCEYRGGVRMTMINKTIEAKHNLRCTVL